MASMKFDQNTVSKIQYLIEEHKYDMEEGEYIEMCNATKYLHDITNEDNITNEDITNDGTFVFYGYETDKTDKMDCFIMLVFIGIHVAMLVFIGRSCMCL